MYVYTNLPHINTCYHASVHVCTYVCVYVRRAQCARRQAPGDGGPGARRGRRGAGRGRRPPLAAAPRVHHGVSSEGTLLAHVETAQFMKTCCMLRLTPGIMHLRSRINCQPPESRLGHPLRPEGRPSPGLAGVRAAPRPGRDPHVHRRGFAAPPHGAPHIYIYIYIYIYI